MRLRITQDRFPADSPLRKNHVQGLCLSSRMLSELFHPFVCGVRADAECHGRPY